MKKRIIGLLLCIAMLIGVMPVGILTVSAADVGVITNVVVEYNDDLSVKVTFDGYEGVSRYMIYVSDDDYSKDLIKSAIDSEEYRISSESENNGRISFVLTKLKDLTLNGNFYKDDRNDYFISVYGYNKYDDVICESPWTSVTAPHREPVSEKTPLPDPGKPYFFGDGSASFGNGMIGFDSVDGAAYYTVSLSYNGKFLAKKTVTESYADFSDYLEKELPSPYSIQVIAIPRYPENSQSVSTNELHYATSDKLIGGARVTKDKKIIYSGQLAYLNDYYATIYHSWETLIDGEWKVITDAEKNNYDYSMLRVKFVVGDLYGEYVTADLTGTNPDFPLIITDSEFFFDNDIIRNQVRQKQHLYVKLGADISNKIGDKRICQFGINIYSGSLDVDLAGYTLSYKCYYSDSSHDGSALFTALEEGRVIIRDSRRYDEKIKKWRDGQILYTSQFNTCNTSVLMGNITIESGEIINDAHHSGEYKHRGYYGKTLIMNGGLIQADYPVYFKNGSYVPAGSPLYINDECGIVYEKWKYGIFGGELITTRGAVLSLYCDTHLYNHEFLKGVFTVANCEFRNGTGKPKATSVQCDYPADITEETKSDAVKILLSFFPETATHTVGGTVNYELKDDDFSIVDISDVTYKQNFGLCGPEFTAGHIIFTPAEVTLKDLNFNIAWPKPGEKPLYLVVGEESTHFTYTLSWKKQTVTNVFKDMLPSEMFESGKTYEAVITLHPRERFSFNRNNTSQVTTINGEEAYWNYSTNSFTLRLLPRDAYYDIWIGDVRVSETNKNDVLGDGTVKFVKKGEFAPASDTELSGKYLDTLILDNFTMPKDCYATGHPDIAQIYIGQDVYILLRGTNTLDSGSVADGIYSDGRQMLFYGNGSLNIDVRQRDKTAINCPGSQISLFENVQLTAKGARGIYDPFDGAGENGVYVEDNASLSCYACQTDDNHDYPALTGSSVEVSDNGRLTCETQYDGAAISAWGDNYSNDDYDIKVLKHGEYVNNGVTPYMPPNGVNVTGGIHESDCRYIYIGSKTTSSLTISGTVTSFGNASATTTIALYKSGQSTPTYTKTVTGNNMTYSISGVAAGTYTMRVSKVNHVTREYTVTVGSENVTQDVMIHLRGDVDGDGGITTTDARLTLQKAAGKIQEFPVEK